MCPDSLTTIDDRPALTASELAERLDGALRGDGTRVIRGVAPLEIAGPDDLAWLGDVKYLPQLTTSRAGVVVVPRKTAVDSDHTLIEVDDPDWALCDALAALAPPVPTLTPGIAPTAIVAKSAVVRGAAIGPNVYVGPHTFVGSGTQIHAGVHIGPDCRIGEDCVVWPNVVIRERSIIGNRVVIHPNATIGADGFGYLQRDGRNHKIPQIGHVCIEDDVEIGANSCIDRARSGETRIGRGTKIDNLVQVGHNVRVGEHCIIVALAGVSGSSSLGNHVMLAGQVGISDHVHLGDGVVVAAKSGVSSDVEKGQIVRGIPAVDAVAFARSAVALKRLPKLVEEVRALSKRIEELESSADH